MFEAPDAPRADGKAMWSLMKETASRWYAVNAPRLGAALAYYTIFSMAPLLVVAIGIAGLFFGREAAEGQIVYQIRDLIGPQGAEVIQGMLQSAAKPASGITASLIGVVVLFFGASAVFGELRDALNTIWGVKADSNAGFMQVVRSRLFSFAMVFAIGFLLMVSLLLSAWLAAAGKYFSGLLPMPEPALQLINIVIGFIATTVLFAMIYRFVPDIEIAWTDIWIGAAVTSLLFSLGKFLIGVYLGKASIGSAYGAAGSLVILLAWVYYSAQVFFMGAEFTHLFAERYGSRFRGGRREPGELPHAA